MHTTFKLFALPALLAGLAAPALAADYQSSATQYIKDHVKGWVEAPEILAAIQAQNDANAVLSQAQIDSLDAAWRADSVGIKLDRFDLTGLLIRSGCCARVRPRPRPAGPNTSHFVSSHAR